MKRCPGHCCAAFHIAGGIRKLRQRAPRVKDGAQIVAMLVPLTPREANERHRRAGNAAIDDHPFRWRNRGHHFTCRHWDEATKLCTIYADRPGMCRAFPYGKPCPFGCDEEGTPMEELRASDAAQSAS